MHHIKVTKGCKIKALKKKKLYGLGLFMHVTKLTQKIPNELILDIQMCMHISE